MRMGKPLCFAAMFHDSAAAPKIPLSVVIVARNEERNLRECLESVAFAEEIVLVDDFSEDATAEIAAEFGAKVFRRAMNGDWGAQKNFALEQATQDWVLLLDCDERVTPALAAEIRERVASGEKRTYAVRRVNHFKGVRVNHGVLRPDWVARLLPRAGTRVEGFVHERVLSPCPPARLRAPLFHYTYATWRAYLEKLEKYTRLAAEKSFAEGKRARFFRDVVLRPAFAFFKMYVLQGGFLDGKIGWILSVNHYFYTEMKYVRLYFLQRERGKAG